MVWRLVNGNAEGCAESEATLFRVLGWMAMLWRESTQLPSHQVGGRTMGARTGFRTLCPLQDPWQFTEQAANKFHF